MRMHVDGDLATSRVKATDQHSATESSCQGHSETFLSADWCHIFRTLHRNFLPSSVDTLILSVYVLHMNENTELHNVPIRALIDIPEPVARAVRIYWDGEHPMGTEVQDYIIEETSIEDLLYELVALVQASCHPKVIGIHPFALQAAREFPNEGEKIKRIKRYRDLVEEESGTLPSLRDSMEQTDVALGFLRSQTECRHCGRRIVLDPVDGWVDPEATGDDRTWRETCDAHDTFEARHEPI